MKPYLYILTAFAVSLLIRTIPLTLIRKPIKNQFIQSFLYYVPYVTLSVMTFPAILKATDSPTSGVVALIVSILTALRGASLFVVAGLSCLSVLITELLFK